jgi:serine/threonine-protein kinase
MGRRIRPGKEQLACHDRIAGSCRRRERSNCDIAVARARREREAGVRCRDSTRCPALTRCWRIRQRQFAYFAILATVVGEHPENETAQFPPGTMLDDKYRIDRLLAIGGMGAVYVGSHTKLKKKVAIKVLRTELANADDAVERFQREAVAASQIGHDNIVEVTDLGTTNGGVAFLVMEYLNGTNLADRIKREGPLPIAQAADIALEVLSAMDAAHNTGIVHRDLKPENVFLAEKSRGETVKILDFGISRMRSGEDPDNRLTQTGTVMGTPYYMSPEQARGATDIGNASDIYSTGVILYEMLTGSLPYDADNYNMVMFRVISGEWVTPSNRREELPPELESIVCKAMALAPEDRYPSAAAPWAERAKLPRRMRSTSNPDGPHTRGMSTAETMASDVGTAPTVAHDTGQGTAPTAMAPSVAVPSAVAPRKSRAPVFVIIGGVLAAAGAALFAFGGLGGGGADGTDADRVSMRAVAADPGDEDGLNAGVGAGAVDVAPADVAITFLITPSDARIILDGVPLDGTTAERESSSTPVEVVIEREGYVTREKTVTFDVNQRIELALDEVPKPAGKSRRAGKPKPGTEGEPAGTKKKKRIVSDSPYD